MKFYITDKNMKSTTGVRDIPYFSTQEDRDKWVSENLLDGKTIDEAINTSNEYNTQILNIVDTAIEVPYTASIVNKNYVIVRDDISDKDLFYHIRNMDMNENSNMVVLTLELDSLMTYWEWVDSMNNIEITQGHGPFSNYFNYEFDGLNRDVKDMLILKRNSVIEGDDKDTFGSSYQYTYVVYRALESGEEGAEINFTTVPYRIFLAPAKRIKYHQSNDNEEYIDPNRLLEYFAGLADDLTYGIQILPYNFFQSRVISGIEPVEVSGFSETSLFKPSDFDYHILELKKFNFPFRYAFDDEVTEEPYINNTYTFKIDKDKPHHFGYLKGIEDEKLLIPGVAEIDWPFNNVDYGTEGIELYIGAYLAPNENKSFITWNRQPYIQNESNTWENDTELAVFVNQLNEYKANNPVQSKTEALNFIPATFRGAVGGSVIGGPTGALIGGATSFASSAAGFIFDRMNKKKAPNSVSGKSNSYFTRANSVIAKTEGFEDAELGLLDISYRMTKFTYDYKGNERESIFEGLYRYGGGYENGLFAENYAEIKRPKFNFMILNNFDNSKLNLDLPDNVANNITTILTTIGVRIWNDGFLDYEEDYSGNGDKING